MTGQLQVLQHHDPYQVADMQGICRRVYADIRNHHFPALKQVLGFRGHILDHPAPAEFFNEIHRVDFMQR
jgi:hypothetical protein